MKRLNFIFLILFGVCIFGGCASNPTQEAALLLVDQLDNYQASVAEKVKAERAFYQDIRSALDKAASRQTWVDQAVETRNRITRLTDQAIVIKYLIGREVVIEKAKVVNYKRKKYYHKGVHFRWTFALESGKELLVKVDYLKNEAGVTEAIDEFCHALTIPPD